MTNSTPLPNSIPSPTPVLEVKDLCIHYIGQTDIVAAVKNVSFSIAPGEVFGLAGESGCGKSTIAFAISRLTSLPGLISGGEILFQGNDVLKLNKKELNKYRWAQASMVFQSAMDSLNPVISIAEQICDAILAHRNVSEKQALARSKELLDLVGIDPERIHEFPHQFSGGMRQRIGIALALVLEPKLIIMDEPTTALDVVVQRDIIQKIFELKEQFGFSILFISHDLSMMAEFADRIGVMKEGVLLEVAKADQIWVSPKHEYTRQLGNAFLSLNKASGSTLTKIDDLERQQTPILELKNVTKEFKTPAGWLKSKKFRALNDVSFKLRKGRALALVGESGSGKSTCARILSKVYQPTSGEILYKGDNVWSLNSSRQKRDYKKAVQMIFQDPFSSLNPTLTIGYHLLRPLEIHFPERSKAENTRRSHELLTLVGLEPAEEMADRYPHELSGGQRQRVAIARVLAIEPDIILADEPTSMLDVSLRTGVLNLLQKLKDELDIAFLYITHDIATARYFAEEIAVLYGGTIVEWGESTKVTQKPMHPYTQLLLESVPNPDRPISERMKEGRSPLRNIWDPKGAGCTFAQCCSESEEECSHANSGIIKIEPEHFIRAFHYQYGMSPKLIVDAKEKSVNEKSAPEKCQEKPNHKETV